MWMLIQIINLIIHPSTRNIHIKKQWPNYDSITDFIKILLCLMLINFDNIERTEIFFLPAFLHNADIYSIKFRFLSICKTSNFCLLLSLITSSPNGPKHFHVNNQIPTGGIKATEVKSNKIILQQFWYEALLFFHNLHIHSFKL